jgi:hypothetical protein
LTGVERYFCVLTAGKYQCDIGDGQLDECDRGILFYHLNTKVSNIHSISGYLSRITATATSGIFTGAINITKPIDLPEVGMYTFSFYTFIYCPKLECDTDDFISVKIRESGSDFREIFRTGTLNGRIRDQKWVKETVNFNVEEKQIFVSFSFIISIIQSTNYFLVTN